MPWLTNSWPDNISFGNLWIVDDNSKQAFGLIVPIPTLPIILVFPTTFKLTLLKGFVLIPIVWIYAPSFCS